ncbi:MAG: two-component system NtrC family sensor kinase [Alteromonas macleodii]|jgi:two-component system NtrC family sensor kinase
MKSVRLRLLILALLPLMVVLPISLAVSMDRWSHKFDDLLISKVSSDLRIAEQYMQRIVTTQSGNINALAESVRFKNAIQTDPDSFIDFLESSRKNLGLDYLVLRKAVAQDYLAPEHFVVQQALSYGNAESIEIFHPTDLIKISSEVARRASIPLIATEAAILTDRQIEDRGMVVLGATHVIIDSVDLVLIGGTVLNRNLEFIDTINDLVYSNEPGQPFRTGTATLFLEDVRISTNVRLFENVRALGTRVSEIVYRTVLENGETWLDSAFVVNDWYISGYLPILDGDRERIGMLYVGFLEQPYATLKITTYIILVSAFFLVLLISVPFFLWIARGIFKPLEEMHEMMVRFEAGDLDARIEGVKSNDEIGNVARHLDKLLDQIQNRDGELRDAASQLNQRVDARTQELRETNERLEVTYRQLVMSEKLAAIGEITAGVAHEINNPVAVIQGNMEIIRSEVDLNVTSIGTEIDLIDAQVIRINAIVGKLLQFARPSEFGESFDTIDMRNLLEDCLVLVSHTLVKSKIAVVRDFGDVNTVIMNQVELQQIVINLMINAAQAMPDGGILTLKTQEIDNNNRPGVQVAISDNGTGIDTMSLNHIFDPFFTTKQAVGTGLGLSISQSLVQRAGGNITTKSKIGIGSTFFIWVPQHVNLSSEYVK